jgi:outer membrane protein OmpA-like peptidoglycan-associated protein/tetratricopeptide (TPR) repeat protein
MKNRLVLFLWIVIFSCSLGTNLYAQSNAGAQKIYVKALAALNNQETEKGIQLLESSLLIDSNFVDSYISLFQVYLTQKQYKKAISNFEKAYSKDSLNSLPYIVKYANAYASIGDFNKAFEIIQPFSINAPSYLRQSIEDLLKICNYAIQHPANSTVKVTNVGDSVNTNEAEYFPTVTVQDSLLLFMRKDGFTREDFYYSTISSNGYSKAKPLSDTLNFAFKKGAPSLSADLNTLYFSAEYAETGFGRYDIYKVSRTKNGWTKPKNLGPNINTDWWESAPSIAPDGQALYFCSNMPGGFGGIDIYVSYKNQRGGWGEVVNLGPNINTAGDEQTPFIHADNKTLYFASNGWPGYGGADLFVSHKKLDGSWSKPTNLGFPINTNDNEGSIAISGNGMEGYIASDRADSRGGLDLYKVTLPENVRANKTVYFNGYISDAVSLKPLSGNVKLADVSDSNKFMLINVDSTGYFVLALPYFDSLGIQINSPQHEYASMLLSKEMLSQIASSTIPFKLNPIQKQFTKNFNNVFFEINAARLMAKSNVELNALVAYLEATPAATILIEGHTDNTGIALNNITLSAKRAEAIAQYLYNKGIAPKRVTTKGYGASKPIADNGSEAGRAQNRRTSFTITIP